MTYSFKTSKIKIATYAGVLAGLTLFSIPLYAQADGNEANNSTIIVNATGETQATPDMAVINLAVVTNDKTARLALEDNTKSMNAVIESFKKSGVEARDLQTSGLSIYQTNQNNADGKQIEKSYQVSNSLTVRVRNLNDAGKLFDEAMSLGVNSVNGITFTNANTKPFFKEARKQAVNEAIEKATTLAEAAHVKLGRIIEIDEPNFGQSPMPRLTTMAKADAYSGTQFAAGELNYTVNVTVKFAIAE